ncbi:hypothetical protein [Luteibacter sp. CQ10]|uniref:hypothetical protein n=1 Tax=Luteibacter sp. CQ10 TaxID=2805821 RepID=UPI0034A2D9C9
MRDEKPPEQSGGFFLAKTLQDHIQYRKPDTGDERHGMPFTQHDKEIVTMKVTGTITYISAYDAQIQTDSPVRSDGPTAGQTSTVHYRQETLDNSWLNRRVQFDYDPNNSAYSVTNVRKLDYNPYG